MTKIESEVFNEFLYATNDERTRAEITEAVKRFMIKYGASRPTYDIKIDTDIEAQSMNVNVSERDPFPPVKK